MRGAASALVLALLAAPSHAGPADRHVVAGYEAFERGEYEAAVASFRAAYAVAPEPRYLLNIALSYGRMGDGCATALETLEQFFEVCGDCPQRAAALRDRERQRKACRSVVEVDSVPRDAEVRVADEVRGRTPVSIELNPGQYTLAVRHPGFVPVQERIELAGGDRARLHLGLRPRPPTDGTLAVRNAPAGTRVTVDGTELTHEPHRVAAGAHTLVIRPEDGPPRELRVSAHAGGATEVDLADAPGARTPRRLRPWAWTAGVVGVAGLATGLTFTTLLLDDLERERNATTAADGEDARADATRDALLAQVGAGLALAGLGASIALWVLDETPEDDGPVTLRLGPTGAGLHGRF